MNALFDNMAALDHQNRRSIRLALGAIKTLVKRLEDNMDKEPDGIIPWIQLEGLSEETSKLIYFSGHVNAICLSGIRHHAN